MKLSELTAEEQIVLLGLMREVVQADGKYSSGERVEVAKLEQELGGDAFVAATKGATDQFTSRDKLMAATRAVERTEARRVILSRLVKMASADHVHEEEEAPLRWLSRVWPDAGLYATEEE